VLKDAQDTDQSGSINRDELKKMLQECFGPENVDDQLLEEIFDENDKNKDGKINFKGM
jgi:Ca2+-binding EF-hand superfamily protein